MIFNKLTDKDKDLIEFWLSAYGGADSECSKRYYNKDKVAPLNYLLRVWEDNKEEYLYKLLGENFIIKKNITFKKNKENLVEEVINHLFCDYAFITNFKNFICQFSQFYNLNKLIKAETLATNRYDGKDFEIELPTGKKLKVREGCKPIRVLGKIADIFNIEGFENFRIAHSQVLNQKEISGELCLSIHPMDYLTMSDNDCGWDSCMSWTENGDYRRGTVEMMDSPMVVVAYLTSESPYWISSDKTWNNKKWRQLFIINKDVITHIKGYPYENDSLNIEILNWLRDLAKENLGWTYRTNLERITPKEYVHIDDKDYRFFFDTEYMYNDYYDDHLIYLTTEELDNNYYCNFSGPAVCICCGEIECNYYDPSLVSCDDCEEITVCEYCEERVDETLTEIDGIGLCSECYEDHTSVCPICGEIHINYNLHKINLANSHNELHYYNDFYVCDNCYNQAKNEGLKENPYFNEGTKFYKGRGASFPWSRYRYVLIEDCKDEFFSWIDNFYENKADFLAETERRKEETKDYTFPIERII